MSDTRYTRTVFHVEPAALSAKQAATYLNISPRKLDELQSEGSLLPIRIGRKRLFTRKALDAFIESISP